MLRIIEFMKRLFVLFTFAALFISSCSTDFEINADWKEITVVYGLLDQKESVHYIKINKAFLGEGNALTFAQNPDSASYGGNLEVWIEEWQDSYYFGTYPLDTVTIFNKDSGVFYYPKQLLYRFVKPNLNENSTYKLFIKNKLNGNLVTSETQLVGNLHVTEPSSLSLISFIKVKPVKVKFSSAKYGRIYEIKIRLNYWEKNNDTNDSTFKHIDWSIGTLTSNGINGGEAMETSYNGASFFSFLGDNIRPVGPNIKRYLGTPNVEFIFSVAGEELATYIEVSKPSTGISQEKPEYSNIKNGIGIFSSRYSEVLNYAMEGKSQDSLKNGQYTKKLNFQ